jgi:hypothetical protein
MSTLFLEICINITLVEYLTKTVVSSYWKLNFFCRYIGYYVRLEEGQPPKHYYDHLQVHWKADDWLQHYLKEHRQKSVPLH